MMLRRLLLLTVAGAMLALAPVADVSQISGLYDNTDYDNVVLTDMDDEAFVKARPLDALHCDHCARTPALLTDESLHATLIASSNHTRAPPAF